jgi:MSHA biogenesis protein MshQ
LLLRIFAFISAIVCLLPSALASVISNSINVDNSFKVYISTDDSVRGTLLGSIADDNWWITYDFTSSLIPGQDYYLHIKATNLNGVGGFLGGFTIAGTDHLFSNNRDDVTTNPTTWLVSTTGWNNYQPATSYGANGDAHWGFIPTIPVRAKWIWSSNNNADNIVYFSTKIKAVELLAHYKLEEPSWNGASWGLYVIRVICWHMFFFDNTIFKLRVFSHIV